MEWTKGLLNNFMDHMKNMLVWIDLNGKQSLGKSWFTLLANQNLISFNFRWHSFSPFYPNLAVEEVPNYELLLGHSHFAYVEPLSNHTSSTAKLEKKRIRPVSHFLGGHYTSFLGTRLQVKFPMHTIWLGFFYRFIIRPCMMHIFRRKIFDTGKHANKR